MGYRKRASRAMLAWLPLAMAWGLSSGGVVAYSAETKAADKKAPAAVADLEAGDATAGSVLLTWTAPGDDGTKGTAASYELRYSTAVITNDNWTQAKPAAEVPTPEPSGRSQYMHVTGLAPGTAYYFAIKAGDAAGNVAAISNVASGKTAPAEERRIPLTPSMVTDEGAIRMLGKVGAEGIADEQGTYPNGAPTTSWVLNTKMYHVPAMEFVDLGAMYHITRIAYFDGAGEAENGLVVSTGSPFHWTESFSDNLDHDAAWQTKAIDRDTRYVRLQLNSANAHVNEIALFGYPLGPTIRKPEPIPHVKPNMETFIGMNAIVDDDVPEADGAMDVVDVIREYHNWSWDAGGSPPAPNEQNSWNPSYAAGGAWNFDAYYKSNAEKGKLVSPTFKRPPAWLPHNSSATAMTAPTGTNSLEPSAYTIFSDYLFQYAARYGSTKVDPSLLKIAPNNPVVSGLGVLKYIENWNEPNNYWGTNAEHFSPYEFAAMTSANYDGHEGTLGKTVGIKQADPQMKVVLGGFASFELVYLDNMRRWFENNRSDHRFAADVINFHAYCTNGSSGVSPEDPSCRLKESARQAVDYRDMYLPGKEVWVSEFGYDVNQGSPQRAPIIGDTSAEEVQAQWLVRSYLALAAAGVDKAHMYFLRDAESGNPGKYSTAGLVTGKGEWSKRPAWYYVATLRHVLEGTRFLSEVTSDSSNVRVYKFKNPQDGSGVYAIWSPTSSNATVDNYKLLLSGKPASASLITMENGNTEGVTTPLKITGGQVTVNVSERPIFVKTNRM